MFLQYAPSGALVPLFSLRLQELGFTPVEIGWACATQALATLVGPLAAGQVADRWWPADRCLTVCGLVAGVLLWLLARLADPWSVFAVSLAFWLFMAPATTLSVALTLAHLPDPERDYGPVRLWGTVGWVVPGWLLGYWFKEPAWLGRCLACLGPGPWHSELADAFRLAGLFALALGLYGLTLPRTPPRHRLGSPLAPLVALRLFRDPSFAVVAVGSLGVCLTMAFASQGVPLLLEGLGVSRPWVGPLQTLCQGTEVVAMPGLPFLLPRFGMRRIMLAGLIAWAVGLTAFAAGGPLWLVVALLGTWGLVVCGYLVTGQVFVNGRARSDVRASAQALLTLTNGWGMLAGSVLAGWVRDLAHGGLTLPFAVAAGSAFVLVVVFAAGFRPGAGPSPSAGALARRRAGGVSPLMAAKHQGADAPRSPE
jgi:MFS family permease